MAETYGPSDPVPCLIPASPAQSLMAIATTLRDKPVTIQDMWNQLGDNAALLMVLIFCAPFMTPVTLPGLSGVCSAPLALFGLSLVLHRPLKLPGFVLRFSLPSGKLGVLLSWATKPLAFSEKHLRPRLHPLISAGPWQIFNGLIVILSAGLLALPLPPFVLFSNFLPASVILLVCLAMMSRDGVAMLAAWFMLLVTLTYFAILTWASFETVLLTWNTTMHWWSPSASQAISVSGSSATQAFSSATFSSATSATIPFAP